MTGDELKAWRARWKITQVALAARLGVNHSTVWRWEDKGAEAIPERVAFAIRGVERDLHDEKRRRPDEG